MRYQACHIYMPHTLLFSNSMFEEIMQRLIATLEQTYQLSKHTHALMDLALIYYEDTLPIQIQQSEQLLMNAY